MPELSDSAKHNLSVAFGVPKTLLDSEAANYATAQEDRKSFYEETILPRARKYESILNAQLLEREGLVIKFNAGELELFQEDEGKRAELVQSYVTAGMPLQLALDLAGVMLTDEQAALLIAKDDQEDEPTDPVDEELGRWMRMAEKRVKDGKTIREFETDIIPDPLHAAITGALEAVKTPEEVKFLFEHIVDWQGYP